MADVVNPIIIGFDWVQTLVLPADTLVAGDDLRAAFRTNVTDNKPLFTLESGDGIDVTGQEVTLELTEAQTALIPVPSSPAIPATGNAISYVYTDIVRRPDGGAAGDDVPLGFTLKIPAVLQITRSEA